MQSSKGKTLSDKLNLSLGPKKEIVKNAAPDIEKAIEQIHESKTEKKQPEKRVRSTVDLSDAEHRRMKLALLSLDKSSQVFIREAILEKLERIVP